MKLQLFTLAAAVGVSLSSPIPQGILDKAYNAIKNGIQPAKDMAVNEAVEWNGPRITHLSPTYRPLFSLPSPTLPFESPSNPPQIPLQSQPNPPRISLESSSNLPRISLESLSNPVKS